jgi:hypothetical protein
MDMEVSENLGNLLAVFLLLLLPLLLLLVAVGVGYMNVIFYLLAIFWFCMGVIFYGAIHSS